MKFTLSFLSILASVGILAVHDCRAADSLEKLENCYRTAMVADQTKDESGTKTTEVLSEEQMVVRCNKKVIEQASNEKDLDQVLALAGLIGRNSNWESAAPVYVIAAKLDQKKTCNDENAIRAIKNGVAHPADYGTVKGARLLMEGCWPEDKAMISRLLTEAEDSYTKESVCPFLRAHKVALTALKKSICEGPKQ
jgi:hypothetical protein